jgi:histidine ammonia-lyase
MANAQPGGGPCINRSERLRPGLNLRDAVTIQMNGTEHNPVTRVNVSPKDSWELSTPQAMKYYVKGSAANNNKHGFIFSNANWDPYPLSNRLESFTIALANMDVAVMSRALDGCAQGAGC